MSKSDEAIRKFARSWGNVFEVEDSDDPYSEFVRVNRSKLLLADLTALISEHYVSKDKYMDDLVDEYERGFRDGRGDVNNNDR